MEPGSILRTIDLVQGRLSQLKAKLAEYHDRLDSFKPPEEQKDTRYKIRILARLLNKGRVVYDTIGQEIIEQEGSQFNLVLFTNAFGVVADYNLTGGKHLKTL